jgi:hypothetical protein
MRCSTYEWLRNAYSTSVAKPRRKRPLGRSRCRWRKYSGTSVYIRFGISPTWYTSCLDAKNFVRDMTFVWNTTRMRQNESRHRALPLFTPLETKPNGWMSKILQRSTTPTKPKQAVIALSEMTRQYYISETSWEEGRSKVLWKEF